MLLKKIKLHLDKRVSIETQIKNHNDWDIIKSGVLHLISIGRLRFIDFYQTKNVTKYSERVYNGIFGL